MLHAVFSRNADFAACFCDNELVVSKQQNDLSSVLEVLLRDPKRVSGVPICQVVPIRWRQIFRASFARFFRSRLHASIVLLDALLLIVADWDELGILSIPIVNALLVLLLMYEAIFFACDLFYQVLYYRSYHFDIREQSVVIRRGVLCKKELNLPLHCITDVYLDQDFFGRVLGLYDLHVSSPTNTSGRFAHMLGIDHHGAHTLRRAIITLINRADLGSAVVAPASA